MINQYLSIYMATFCWPFSGNFNQVQGFIDFDRGKFGLKRWLSLSLPRGRALYRGPSLAFRSAGASVWAASLAASSLPDPPAILEMPPYPGGNRRGLIKRSTALRAWSRGHARRLTSLYAGTGSALTYASPVGRAFPPNDGGSLQAAASPEPPLSLMPVTMIARWINIRQGPPLPAETGNGRPLRLKSSKGRQLRRPIAPPIAAPSVAPSLASIRQRAPVAP